MNISMKNPERIVYSLNVEDVQNVAKEILDRKLSAKEVSLVENKLADLIDWRGAIELAIYSRVKRH